MAVTCKISLKSSGFHGYNLTLQQQFLSPYLLLVMAAAQPEPIKAGWPQEPGSLPCSPLHRRADRPQLHERRSGSAPRHGNPQPTEPHRSASWISLADQPRGSAPRTSPVDQPRESAPRTAAKWPDGSFGLWPRLCLHRTEVRPKYHTLEGGAFRTCMHEGNKYLKEHFCSR